MEKTKVYYIENNNFRHYLKDYLENKLIEDLKYSIPKKKSEMKYIFDEVERSEKIKFIIRELQKNIVLDWFKNFTYVFDFETNNLRFDISGLSDVEMHYSYNKNCQLEIFSLSEHIDISYNLDNVIAIEITDENNLYDTFIRINDGLIIMVRKFILYEYWIKEYKKLQNKGTQTIVKTPLQETIDLSNTKGTGEIKFNLSLIELIELVKALIENGSIKGKQKDIIKTFSQFFEVEVKHENKTIQDLKKRNNGSETLFLDKLKTSLYNYITKENRR